MVQILVRSSRDRIIPFARIISSSFWRNELIVVCPVWFIHIWIVGHIGITVDCFSIHAVLTERLPSRSQFSQIEKGVAIPLHVHLRIIFRNARPEFCAAKADNHVLTAGLLGGMTNHCGGIGLGAEELEGIPTFNGHEAAFEFARRELTAHPEGEGRSAAIVARADQVHHRPGEHSPCGQRQQGQKNKTCAKKFLHQLLLFLS